MAKSKATIKVASAEEKTAKAANGNSMKKAVGTAVNKKFDLENYKKSKNLIQNVKFKDQQWIPLSPAFNDAISLPGLPHGHVIVLRGHSDTGKTSTMLDAAKEFQKAGILPVFIITEMKFSWDYAKQTGFPVEETVDTETGEILYTGDFIYIDRSSLNSIEDVAAFIMSLLDDQKKGVLQTDVAIFWDSVGSIPSNQSLESGKNNAMWNASALSTQFGNFINQRITLSRKASEKYTNSLVIVSKVRIEYPMSGNPKEQPVMKNKGGDVFYWDASLVITHGNITKSGVTKLVATKNGKRVEWGKRTNIRVDKNHITDTTTTSKVIMTSHGFIRDDPKEIEAYKKAHRDEWLKVLGTDDFDMIEEEDARSVFDLIEEDE